MLEPVGEVNVSWIVLEGDGEVLFEDEEQDHHHLHWCLNAPANAVPNLNNNHRTYYIDGWQMVKTYVPPIKGITRGANVWGANLLYILALNIPH